MANFPDITVKISDEDREMLARFSVNIAWLRDHLEEIRAFAQTPAFSISSPSNPVVPLAERDDSLPGWQRFIIQQIDKSASTSLSHATSVVWNTNDLPPNTTYKVRIGDKDYSTICLDCGKPLSECKCADPRTGICAVVDQPGD